MLKIIRHVLGVSNDEKLLADCGEAHQENRPLSKRLYYEGLH